MARRPSYPKVNFQFTARDPVTALVSGMILFFLIGGISLIFSVAIGLIFILIGFLLLVVLLYAISFW